MSIWKGFSKFGPATLVTAAFIGPGTITTCTIAGTSYGYALIWALIFSAGATMILQEMSARLGIVGRKGLGSGIREMTTSKGSRIVAIVLIISAIGIGNAAYETGNIIGGTLGLEAITGKFEISLGQYSLSIWPLIIGLTAFILLFSGNYKVIELFLVGLVILMSLTFITTAFIVKPDISGIFKGSLIPSVPPGAGLTIVALIGTTVVPYNLFLHSSAAKSKWNGAEDLPTARKDSFVSIGVGGLISIAIIITASSAFFGQGGLIRNAGDLAVQLEPLLGNWAKYFLSAGLLAAGVSSTITAPLAAAYAVTGILGKEMGTKGLLFRFTWITVLATGVLFSSLGLNPISVITFAQFANGLLLPVIAGYLLWVMNRKEILGKHVNTLTSNILGIIVLIVTIALGLKSIAAATGII